MSRRLTGAGLWRRFARNKRTSASEAPFSPLDFGPIAWYRETYAAGTWSDLSGNGRNVTQGTAGARPTQVTRAGQLALSFDGGDLMSGAFGSVQAQPLTVYCIAEPVTLTGVKVMWDGDDATNRAGLYTLDTTRHTAFATTELNGGTPSAAIHGYCVVYNGVSSAIYVDNFATPVASGNAGTAGLDGLTVGANYLAGNLYIGYMWEWEVVSGAHNASNRALFAAYANARYSGLNITT